MGKALIIPGADFSQNAIERENGQWLTSIELTQETFSNSFQTSGYACHYQVQALQGKTISKIRVLTASAGIITIKSTESLDDDNVNFLETLQIEVPQSSEFIEINLPQPLSIPANGGIMIYAPEILKFNLHGGDLPHYTFITPLESSSRISKDYTNDIVHSIGFYGE